MTFIDFDVLLANVNRVFPPDFGKGHPLTVDDAVTFEGPRYTTTAKRNPLRRNGNDVKGKGQGSSLGYTQDEEADTSASKSEDQQKRSGSPSSGNTSKRRKTDDIFETVSFKKRPVFDPPPSKAKTSEPFGSGYSSLPNTDGMQSFDDAIDFGSIADRHNPGAIVTESSSSSTRLVDLNNEMKRLGKDITHVLDLVKKMSERQTQYETRANERFRELSLRLDNLTSVEQRPAGQSSSSVQPKRPAPGLRHTSTAEDIAQRADAAFRRYGTGRRR